MINKEEYLGDTMTTASETTRELFPEPTMYTHEMVYDKLGLEASDEFAKKVKAKRLDLLRDTLNSRVPFDTIDVNEYLAKGSGRTTQALVEAVVLSQTKVVNIVGYNMAHSNQLQDVARDMCEQLGLDSSKIIAIPMERIKGRRDVGVIIDHYSPTFL